MNKLIRTKALSPPIRRRRFTLIEMLLVVTIALILMGLAIPAFNAMNKHQKSSAAGRLVVGKLKSTRSQAITKNEYVAMLAPIDNDLPEDYHMRSLRLCAVTKSGNSYFFKRWLPKEEWHFLPKGTVVSEIDQDRGWDEEEDDDTCHEVDDVPMGQVDLAEVDGVRAVIFKPSGEIAGLQQYVTIDEGVYQSETFMDTTPDTNGDNIEIDQYTGRVAYESQEQ